MKLSAMKPSASASIRRACVLPLFAGPARQGHTAWIGHGAAQPHQLLAEQRRVRRDTRSLR
jgi:hypothetical protein